MPTNNRILTAFGNIHVGSCIFDYNRILNPHFTAQHSGVACPPPCVHRLQITPTFLLAMSFSLRHEAARDNKGR